MRRLLLAMGRCDQAAGLPVSVAAGRVSGLAFARAHREFTDAELDLLATVQPLLRAVDRHTRLIAGWRGEQHDGIAAARDAGLTAREVAVLSLLAGGRTSAAAARRLGCSPRTVEKHIANVYRKLGVRDRVTAVLEARPRGLVPVRTAGPWSDAT